MGSFGIIWSNIGMKSLLSKFLYIKADPYIVHLKFYFIFLLLSTGSLSFGLVGLIRTILSPYNTMFELRKVEYFFNKNRDNMNTAFSKAFEEGILKIKSNIKWMQMNFDDVNQWLENYLNTLETF